MFLVFKATHQKYLRLYKQTRRHRQSKKVHTELVEQIFLSSLLTGLELKLAQIILAFLSIHNNKTKIAKLNYFESQFSKPVPSQIQLQPQI